MVEGAQQSLENFFENYPEERFDKNEILIHPKEKILYAYFLTEGLVNQYDVSTNGNEIIVRTFSESEVFPLSYLVTNQKNPYYYEAHSPVILRKAPIIKFTDLQKRHPELAITFLQKQTLDIITTTRRNAHLMGGDAKSRLLFEILELASRFGKSLDSWRVIIPFTETDIAKRTGLARETVSRAIGVFKRDHLIEVSPEGLIIRDIDRLRSILGSDL